MKRVILIGDSIRLGYEPAARAALADIAAVTGPAEGTQHTANILFHLWSWVITQDPDVVHINSGHWDTRRVIRGEEGNVIPLEIYRENVHRILTAIRRHTRARIIWATTTPLMIPAYEQTQLRMGGTSRDPDSIARYNEAACAEAAPLGVTINPLHRFVARRGPRRLMHADGAHFTPAGYDALGREVARAVRRELAHAA